MSYTAPAAAVWMGDEVEVKVNCKDEGGVALYLENKPPV